ncbi:hypothetical protein C8046_02350 [Serinibacter arcticus]|uniref:DUF3866 family protein n=1 Tax=Serinibacter arcticus TaxID=1655435 RepID=A0A2U1ZZ86_9MICO|nr:DUF3866 family protein [Serinibacter arcticus]PWD52297.1 hypothetical protein C8046_02350 [Serinibacter arcticus]
MIIWRDGVVTATGTSWRGAVELRVEITAGPAAPVSVAPGTVVKALAYPELVGTPRVGDRVSLTCSALARGLGTGGYAMVAAIPDALPADPPPSPGHLVKARYTPLQSMVLGVDEQESDSHAVLADADDLGGMPVVVADLHSALPAVLAGLRAEAAAAGRPAPRVAYVMTDGGALPAWFSRSLAQLREAGWLEASVTVGQAFGGDLEAVTLHSGLLAAKHVLGVDVVIVAQGPGNLGTGTRWGFSGVAAGEALNAVAVLGGRGVASLRVSNADARGRHRGVSHHSTTAYGRVALAASDVVVPVSHHRHDVPGWDADLGRYVMLSAQEITAPHTPHRLVPVPVAGLEVALRDVPVRLSTMGRTLQDDATPFLAAAAAGRWAARLLAPVTGTIWHLALESDWARAVEHGSYETSTRDCPLAEVGFVHASLDHQVDGVAAAVYGDLAGSGAVLLEIDADALAAGGVAVVREPGSPDQSGDRFPHVYGAVPVTAVRAVRPWRGTLAATTGAGS